MNILIIDDDEFMQKTLSFGLTAEGHQVTVAFNGQEAIQQIAQNSNFHVVICDVIMPVLTGPGFLLQLKRHFPKKLPLIIVVSAVRDGEEFLHKIEIPYDHFLRKPVDQNALMNILKLYESQNPS